MSCLVIDIQFIVSFIIFYCKIILDDLMVILDDPYDTLLDGVLGDQGDWVITVGTVCIRMQYLCIMWPTYMRID